MAEGISGIILAGGKSSRFGSPKAFAKINGIPFYQYTIAAIRPLTESIILVSSVELIHNFPKQDNGITCITDNPNLAGLGPLAGIYSGMEALEAEWYLVSPVDVPFINKEIFEILLKHIGGGIEAIVPIVNGKIEPLISIFHCSMMEKIKEQIRLKELAPKQLFLKSKVNYVEFDDDGPFRNINYQQDLMRYENTDGRGD